MNVYRYYKDGLPTWKSAPCLGCQREVVAARDAHVVFGGRRDGSSLICIGLDATTAFSTNLDELPSATDHFLLGIAHRKCAADARIRLESGQVQLPADLPLLRCEFIDELPAPFNRPPPDHQCPFCGDTNDLSVEDIWPKWMERELLKLAKKDKQAPFEVTYNHESGKRRVFGITAPCCRLCNNRWLSVLENDVKPILLPMVMGRRTRVELDAPSQRLLATWAVKVALMVELSPDFRSSQVSLSPPIIPVGLYNDLRWRRSPHPSNTTVL